MLEGISLEISESMDKIPTTALWRNGYAEACKALYPGSIPGGASSSEMTPIYILCYHKVFQYSVISSLQNLIFKD